VLSAPDSVAVSPTGTILVADTGNHRIQAFDPSGKFLFTFGSLGSGNGQFALPGGVAVGPTGTILVADTSHHLLQEFDQAGQLLFTFGSQGTGSGEFDTPKGVAVGPDGTIVVADTNNACAATGWRLDLSHRLKRFGRIPLEQRIYLKGKPGGENSLSVKRRRRRRRVTACSASSA
jgi:DNA-binding beta-propeller fold protein YncE